MVATNQGTSRRLQPLSPGEGGVLLVSERDAPRPDLGGLAPFTLAYRFVAQGPADGFSAWQVAQAQGVSHVDVAASARSLHGSFAQQALNRFVAQCLLREKPAVLVVCGLWGCTVDLPRLADLMGVPCVFVLCGDERLPESVDGGTLCWLRDAFSRCRHVLGTAALVADERLRDSLEGRLRALDALPQTLASLSARQPADLRFDYSLYEFLLRDHPLLYRMQQADTRHFAGCGRVLDLACGAGIFLDCLRRAGIGAAGVERDARVAEYGRGLDLPIVQGDALDYLQDRAPRAGFDGVYCSHFIEHLGVDEVRRLFDLLYGRIEPAGVLVLVFPDPESIRAQLLGFWRDPEHVRFYHPELVIAMASAAGFVLDWSSYDEQGHEVVSFATEPPAAPPAAELPAALPPDDRRGAPGAPWRARWWRQRAADQAGWREWGRQVLQALASQQRQIEHLRARTDTLWQVNRTWAWNDNATLRFRRAAN